MLQVPQFGFHTTASEVLKDIDLHGKTMIVTGGASGIGIETTAALAAAGASVVVAVRRPEAAEEVAQDLRIRTANPDISVRPLDLADLRSVGRFVDGWNGPIHALVNNAGIMALPDLRRSSQGWEMQFATNYLGHFALTFGLRRFLAKAQGARVVSVSSSGSLFGPVLWDDPHFHFIPYDPLLAYAQSKTACTLLSVGIKQHLAEDGIVSNALNPGAIATNLQRHTGGLRTPEHLRKTPEEGAATSVLLAASPLVEGTNGRYFENCAEAPVEPSSAEAGGGTGLRARPVQRGEALAYGVGISGRRQMTTIQHVGFIRLGDQSHRHQGIRRRHDGMGNQAKPKAVVEWATKGPDGLVGTLDGLVAKAGRGSFFPSGDAAGPGPSPNERQHHSAS